jgi:hypothetical protein
VPDRAITHDVSHSLVTSTGLSSSVKDLVRCICTGARQGLQMLKKQVGSFFDAGLDRGIASFAILCLDNNSSPVLSLSDPNLNIRVSKTRLEKFCSTSMHYAKHERAGQLQTFDIL